MSELHEEVRLLAEQNKEVFLECFRNLHRHPETATEEFGTSAFVCSILTDLGIQVLDYGFETGVVGLLKGGQDGPCIALRADIDALPIEEQSSCPFPSETPGKMHACGHDTHITSLLGAAVILSRMRDKIRGSVKFIFQPAEEPNIGGKLYVGCGVLESPDVSACFSFHNSPEIPTGSVAVLPGPIMAGMNNIDIDVVGKGGHGGLPQKSTDPVVAAAAIIQSLQTVVSRNVAPSDAAVVSICSVHTDNGMITNVIPDAVHMRGTIRFYNDADKVLLNRRIREIVTNVGAAYGCEAEYRSYADLPVTTNAALPGCPGLYDLALRTVREIGAEPVLAPPSGGGDDFCYYAQGYEGRHGVPSFFYWLGVRNEKKDCVYSWHSPHYQADTDALPIGAALLAMSALNASDLF